MKIHPIRLFVLGYFGYHATANESPYNKVNNQKNFKICFTFPQIYTGLHDYSVQLQMAF